MLQISKLCRAMKRNWCRHCVRGKADDVKHVRQDDERMYHVMSVDYTYLTKKGENTNPVLAGYGDTSKIMLALPVSSKGGGVNVAQRVVQWINEIGCGKFILKSDQEPATRDVQLVTKEEIIIAMEEISIHVRSLVKTNDSEEHIMVI